MSPILPLLGLAAVAALALGGGDNNPAQPATPGGIKPVPPGGPVPNNPYDANLTAAELQAVMTALANETDPAKLDAFSQKMLPDHPLASAALSAKANLLRLHAQGGLPIPPITPSPVPSLPLPISPPAVPLPPPPPPPPPAVTPAALFASTPAIVATQDSGPAGNLYVRATPGGAIIGAFAHGASVFITGPSQDGFSPVTGPNASDGAILNGFAANQYLSTSAPLTPAAPALGPSAPIIVPASLTIPNLQTATVTTHDTGPAGNLYVRATPGGIVIGALAHGASVVITGPQTAGFYPVSGHDANTGAPLAGFASALFLTLAAAPATTSAGFAPQPSAIRPSRLVPATRAAAGLDDTSAGPSLPFNELHAAALALKVALDTDGCKAYNEPIVKRFQHAAKLSGLYAGDVDGWYGVDTQGSLARLVGAPAPACFEGPTGGPKNPQEYWSPIGT
jgi:hypothetical protein